MATLKAQYKEFGSNCRLKIFMACDPNYDPGEIPEIKPAFTPLLQLEKLGPEIGMPINHIYKCNWLFNSTVPITNQVFYEPPAAASDHPLLTPPTSPLNNPSLVSPKTAHLFLDEWCMTDYTDINNLFSGMVYGSVQRVKSYTFLEEDLANIMALYQTDNEITICVHLAVIQPNVNTPFPFHIVLEARNPFFAPQSPQSSESTNKLQQSFKDAAEAVDDSTFFEFSYPCPPYCGNGGGS